MLGSVPPRFLGQYEVLSVIGRGGVGTVYRGRHRGTGRVAAVKVLARTPAVDPTAARRLAREFEVLRTLDHPNVVRVYDAGVADGVAWLAMELVEGLDLRAHLSPAVDEAGRAPERLEPGSRPPSGRTETVDLDVPSGGALAEPECGDAAIRALAAVLDEPDTEPEERVPPRGAAPEGAGTGPCAPIGLELQKALNRAGRTERLLVAVRQVLDGLRYVHGRGLVHRDLKPSNIMVDDARRARLMDFGLVKGAHEPDAEPLTATGRVVGTWRYMSPEQAQGGAVDGRSDLYSLGVILYELLGGRPPFTAKDPVLLWREILNVVPAPLQMVNPGVNARLAAVCERLLAKDPAARFASAEEVREALR
jgi:eukaryotic-like serine/threonine-protein kinase